MTKKSVLAAQQRIVSENTRPMKLLSYMTLMLERASAAEVPVRRRDFADYGKTVELFPGVENWFERINKYAGHAGHTECKSQHFIISSGIKEMIRERAVSERKFKRIFASSFAYDVKRGCEMARTCNQLHYKNAISDFASTKDLYQFTSTIL